eukprot:9072126-Alexandrium_andersonii.AAC.1
MKHACASWRVCRASLSRLCGFCVSKATTLRRWQAASCIYVVAGARGWHHRAVPLDGTGFEPHDL